MKFVLSSIFAAALLTLTGCPEEPPQRLMLRDHTDADGLIKALPDTLRSDARFTAAIRALRAGYPEDFVGVAIAPHAPVQMLFATGASFPYDDGRSKTFEQQLDAPDVKDMFSQVYPLTNPTDRMGGISILGGFRIEAMFMAIYGENEATVAKNCGQVDFCGNQVVFNRRNGAAEALRAVSAELTELSKTHPEIRTYVQDLGGTFNWRKIAGTDHLSNHSFGTAIDLNVKKSAYWRWQPASAMSTFSRLDFPQPIIEAFERHQFIWGGKWYHFDTMHFEYRPGLFAYARLR